MGTTQGTTQRNNPPPAGTTQGTTRNQRYWWWFPVPLLLEGTGDPLTPHPPKNTFNNNPKE